MTVGFFSPMPPARTGVADYAAELLPVLRRHFRVEMEPARADINLYQLGNNQLHAAIYRRALREPGVVVLHDAVLHHFALGYFSRDEYIAEFVYNYGAWTRELAENLWNERARSAADKRYFEYPMLKRIVETARAVVVHNPAAASLVRKHHPEARVIEIPHLYTPEAAPPASDILALRERLGVKPTELLCGIFGHLRESKRIDAAVRACEQAGVPILIAGDCPPALEKSLAPVLASPAVRRAGYGKIEQYRLLRQSVNVGINLRYPPAGETSGVGIQMMGTGKPVVMTDAAEIARYPDDTCLRIDAGVRERSHLAAVLTWLNSCRGHARSIGARAAEYIAREHGPDRVGQLYKAVLTSALALLLAFSAAAEQRFLARMPMRDGVRLNANVYLPQSEGRYSTLLIRTPYGKGKDLIPSYRVFLENGFAVVVQDVRGRYESGGHFRPFSQELNDGDDTVSWIAKQSWSDGKVSMLGGSYLGIAQWRAALSGNRHLVSIFPVVSGSDEYRDRYYSRGGAMKLGHRLLWMAENVRVAAPPSFAEIIRHLPLRTSDRVATGRTVNFWQETLAHPAYDAYWRNRSNYERLANIRTPAFIVGGWYDNYVEGDVDAYAALSKGSTAHRLVIGPWGHNMSLPFSSGISFGRQAGAPIRRYQLDWFKHWMRAPQPAPPFPGAPVRLFVMGINRWRDEQEWPLSRAVATPMYLTSRSGANSLHGDGELVIEPARSDEDVFTYDPRYAVQTLGGAVCCNPKVFPYGPMDQRPVEMRRDVLVYSTSPLKQDTEVTGPVRVVLYVATTAPDTDFTAKLVDVFPDGHARNLCDGILRLRYRDGLHVSRLAKPRQVYPITIQAGVTSNVFRAGHRIRVEISSSNFPRFDRNPNTGRSIADERNLQVASQTVYHGKDRPSHVVLPIVPASKQ